MPLDSKDFIETKPDVFSLEGLIAWLETQDPARAYCYLDAGECLAAQFYKLCGRDYKVPLISCCLYEFIIGESHEAPDCSFGELLEGIAAWGGDRSYGAALDRARKLLAAR